MLAVLGRAADSSIAIARAATEVVEIAARQAPFASRFTVSDVGAAAAIARGAAQAALLTARTNIGMIARNPAATGEQVESLAVACRELDERSAAAAGEALRLTNERMPR
jgi:formiminotetrahydrofolate cyclodeaminase